MSEFTAVDGGHAANIDTLLAEFTNQPKEWKKPVEFDLENGIDVYTLEEAFSEGEVSSVVDGIDHIADDLFEYELPDQKGNDAMRQEYVDGVKAHGSKFGKWFLFPWSGELVRYPDKEQHRALRTSRNRNLITDAEQEQLYDSTVAVFGLSVGSKVVEQLVGSGIGGTLILGDPDHITPSNLNRISGGFSHVGMKKIHKVATEISAADPYIEQVHFTDGVTEENLEALSEHRPDVIFDEVDDLRMKALIRQYAKKEGIPVVMATDLGDKSIIDVERYDLEDAKPFGGRLKDSELEKLYSGEVTPEEIQRFMVKIVGITHVTPRVMESVLQVGNTLSGLPQLGTTATKGGAAAAVTAREILLGHDVPSGRHIEAKKGSRIRAAADFIKTLRIATKARKSSKQ
jgi:molybdopterin/thiamine biosynthesis adenylyltransferase